ncbi:neurotrophin 1-like [Sitodiplosis mosellana]|uniref:neurotrophin 1-like n=1 Tax=Sitodiplosis mosellana TaxID=263140 RepID=UPI0024452E78|nr:neurotrophin 1-like [Sitodiplosis mosellana]
MNILIDFIKWQQNEDKVNKATMSQTMRKMSYSCVRHLLIFMVIINVMDLFCAGSPPPKDAGNIVFPDEIHYTSTPQSKVSDRLSAGQENASRRFIADVSRCAVNNQTYCTKDDNYPLALIQSLLQKHPYEYAHVFSSDEHPPQDDIINRDGSFDEIELCDINKGVITPTSAKNKDGVEVYIFNTDSHKQYVRVSTCRSKGRTCKLIVSVPIGYRTECTQQFVYHDLLSLSPDGSGVKDTFPFPACCSCQVYRD